jgi:hypothetical protein
MILSKTDYLVYRECKKNAWMKIHKPDIYKSQPISKFEEMIMKTGGEVELFARKLFPTGILIEGGGSEAQALTHEYLQNKQPILFQAVFEKGGFLAAVDILEYDSEADCYSIYEVKSTNDIDEKTHYHDLAFQVNLLRNCGLKIEKTFLIHLNKEYVRVGDLNLPSLFQVVDVRDKIESLCEEVMTDMEQALTYLSQESLPAGHCACVYKGRSKHCTCFSMLNPDIPEYGVHDIARIGSSWKKLTEMIDGNFFHINTVPAHIKLSVIQQNQVDSYKLNKVIHDKEAISRELKSLKFPLYFIDYETLPCAIPRFNGFSPYNQIPFQYSLYILESPEAEPKLLEFLYVDSDDPSSHFVDSLKEHIGDEGNVIVWRMSFECGRNNEIATRIPEMKDFIDSLNGRVYDLEEIFLKQYYVDKGFRGSTSIKKVLPVLVPSLTYKELAIQDGGSAAETWSRLHSESLDGSEREKIVQDLKKYCGLDAYAMYAIWKELHGLVH